MAGWWHLARNNFIILSCGDRRGIKLSVVRWPQLAADVRRGLTGDSTRRLHRPLTYGGTRSVGHGAGHLVCRATILTPIRGWKQPRSNITHIVVSCHEMMRSVATSAVTVFVSSVYFLSSLTDFLIWLIHL